MKERQILDYCYGHLHLMWAAYVASLILEIDFREVSQMKIDKYIKDHEL